MNIQKDYLNANLLLTNLNLIDEYLGGIDAEHFAIFDAEDDAATLENAIADCIVKARDYINCIDNDGGGVDAVAKTMEEEG